MIIRQLNVLSTQPQVVAEILPCIMQEPFQRARLAEIVEADAALTASVLALAGRLGITGIDGSRPLAEVIDALPAAWLYVLRYDNGNAAFNLDTSNDVGGPMVRRTDRTGVIGTAMPSGVIITFFGGTAVGYAGVGGGVYTPKLPSTKCLVPINWKIIF